MKAATRDTVGALDRGLALLQCFGADTSALGPTELARLTGIPRPSVTRLAATLVAHRWLRPAPDGERFMLGAGVVSLANNFLAGLDVREAARTPMAALAERTGGSVFLALRDGLEMVIIETGRPRRAMLATKLDVGSRVPMPNSALGRAWLGAVDDTLRREVLAELRRANRREGPSLEAALRRALDVRRQLGGVTLSVGEFHAEINSAGVAWVDPRGETLAFNCGGPAFAFPEERLRREIAPALLEMVRTLAAQVGGRVAEPAR